MKKYRHLQAQDRHRIFVLHASGYSPSTIAIDLNRHVSTIRRELARNTLSGGYNDQIAAKLCQKRRSASRISHKLTPEFVAFIGAKIQLFWSPEQICARWKFLSGVSVHWLSVYRWVYQDAASGGSAWKNLRSPRRRPRPRKPLKTLRDLAKARPRIGQRPSQVDDKSRLGDLEIDTLVGPQNRGAIVSIVDRVSYQLHLIQIHGRQAFHLSERVKKVLRHKIGHIHTITSDNGTEFCEYQRIAKTLKIQYFFAEPYQTNQRALIEHENKLIRQYLPKGTDLRFISQQRLNQIANQLNNRPRKKLGFKTPHEILSQILTST